MIETWFTSDTHFGHKNILEYEKEDRPFSSLEEMHEVMIDRWNNVVKPKDIVYHLGDFAFGRRNISIAGSLNGVKRLIMGNHDVYPVAEYMNYFDRIFGVLHWKQCILSHIPVHPDNLTSRWILNIHGHTHSRMVMSNEIVSPDKEYPMNWMMIPDKRYFNVSVEQNNLTPIHRDIIMQRLKEIEG